MKGSKSDCARAEGIEQPGQTVFGGCNNMENIWTSSDPMRLKADYGYASAFGGQSLFPPNMPLDVQSRHTTGPYLKQVESDFNMTGATPPTISDAFGLPQVNLPGDAPGACGFSCTSPGAPPIPWALIGAPASRPTPTSQEMKFDEDVAKQEHQMKKMMDTLYQDEVEQLGCSPPVDDKDDGDVSTAPSLSFNSGSSFISNNSVSIDSAAAGEENLERYPVDADLDASLLAGEFQTLMLKNIPCRSSQQEVLEAIEAVGFGERYNFFYLPIRRGHTQNFGYAFVGFGDVVSTRAFAVAMTGYRFPGRRSPKACAVAPARIQGFCSNVEHFQKTQCMRRKNRPLLSIAL